MTALTYGGETPTVGADEGTWGTELNTALSEIYTDLQMLNTSPTARLLGRDDSGAGEVERLTGAEATALLSAVVGDSGEGGTKGLVPAPASGDAAAAKLLRADGTWGTPIKAWGTVTGTTVAAGRNVASVTAGTGYTVNFTTPIGSTSYSISVIPRSSSALQTLGHWITAKASGSFTVFFGNSGGTVSVDGFDFQVFAA